MTNLLIDLSSNNGSVDLYAAARDGISGAFLKATEGTTYVNPYFASQRATNSGLRVGAYHYARPDRNPYRPEAEAEHFCRVIGKLGRRDLRPVLDLEVWGDDLSPEQMVSWARKFNRVVRKRFGVWPIFYSYPYFINRLSADIPIGNGLWLASYGRNDGKEYPYGVPAPWQKIVAHQFTSRGRVAGVRGDCDVSRAKSLTPLLAHPWLGRV